MVVLQESPDLSKQRQVGDLDLRQLLHHNPRAAVEFLVEIHHGLGRFHSRHVGDRFAVDQEAQIVRPHSPASGREDTEDQPLRSRVQREHDGVLRPGGGPFQLAALHVVEGDRASVIVLAQPETCEIRDICGAQEAAEFELSPSEVNGDRLRDRREAIRARVVPFDPQRPAAAVNDLSVHRKRTRRSAAPILRDGAHGPRLKIQHTSQFGAAPAARRLRSP